MPLTPEQQAVIDFDNNMKVNAVAGSGKTTTLIELAKTRPTNSRILYLAFNKSVRLEAEKRFAEAGLRNVRVETAHSLAYKQAFNRQKYQLQPNGYQSFELVERLEMEAPPNKDNSFNYILAKHINQLAAYFCNSPARKVLELDYLSTLDTKAQKFAEKFYEEIIHYTRTFLAKMYRGEMPITHDFYLKQFQLQSPQLPFDYILFDEGQDASPVMLDVFLKQRAKKVIVGDTHQQIYSWRYAVNSLEQVDFPAFTLSTSFRFNPQIATLAMRFLDLKRLFSDYDDSLYIKGVGRPESEASHAVLSRTNLSLLAAAIEQVIEKRAAKSIYFEGNFSSYTYADEGASVYDVLSLYQGRRKGIRNKLLQKMKHFNELEDYVEKTEDNEMGMLIEMVKKYEGKLPGYVNRLKGIHVPTEKRETADMIFSTTHRCKGMEYDLVTLTNDFITEEKIKKLQDEQKDKLDIKKLNEEVNLLYVAVTRARKQITLPFALRPSDTTIRWSYNNASSSSSKSNNNSRFRLDTDEEDDDFMDNVKKQSWFKKKKW